MFKSGPSLDGSSSNVTIVMDNSASLGVSGAVNISTGVADCAPAVMGELAVLSSQLVGALQCH